MTHIPTNTRSEYRGDFFASDLPVLERQIQELHLTPIKRPHRDTATIFLTPSEDVLPTSKRIRGYGEFSDATDVFSKDSSGAEWQLELKNDTTKQLLARASMAAILKDSSLRAQTMRLASRKHFQLGESLDEKRRLTVDESRRVFAVNSDYRLTFLGDLGPRVEVKAPAQAETTSWIGKLDLQSLAVTLPYRSLELYMQHILKGIIHKNTYAGYPELEAKFSITDQDELAIAYAAIKATICASQKVKPLLPEPSEIVRVRRYHICQDDIGNHVTAVETAAGRLSLKQKTNSRTVATNGAVILQRDTVASHTTDLNGSMIDLETYLNRQGLTRVVTYEKRQRKLPFAYKDGSAYHVSMDLCTRTDDPSDQLAQIELEFIGSIANRPKLDDVYADMAEIAQIITHTSTGLCPTVLDKSHHFVA